MDKLQVILPPPEPEDTDEYRPIPEEVIITPESERIRRPGAVRRVIFGLLTLLLVLSMCLGVGGITALDEIRQYFERREMSAALDTFMVAMSQGDSAAAYHLMAEDFQDRVPYHQLDAMLRGDEFGLFEGYRELEINSVAMRTQRNGTVIAEVTGHFRYDGDFEGDFVTRMIEEEGNWRLASLQIHVSPAKIDAFEGHTV